MASATATSKLIDIRNASYTADEVDFEYSHAWLARWLNAAFYSLRGVPYAPFAYKIGLIDKEGKLVEPNRAHTPLQAGYAGLSAPGLMRQVNYHWEQANKFELRFAYFAAVLLFVLMLALYHYPILSSWGPFRYVAAAFAYTIAVGFTQRMYYVLFGKGLAPSLCANSVVTVNFFLLSDDALSKPEVRKKLLAHIRDLARKTMLLPLCYRSTDAATQRKTYRHFKELECYVRERERQAITPANTTLEDLRRDFKELAAIYLTGQYGRFKWQDAGAHEHTPQESRWKGVPAAVLRFVGFILPLGLMGAYLWQPEFFPGVEVDKKIVVLIFIAWLLLALDVGLKLGVVGQLTSIAKGIKELK